MKLREDDVWAEGWVRWVEEQEHRKGVPDDLWLDREGLFSGWSRRAFYYHHESGHCEWDDLPSCRTFNDPRGCGGCIDCLGTEGMDRYLLRWPHPRIESLIPMFNEATESTREAHTQENER